MRFTFGFWGQVGERPTRIQFEEQCLEGVLLLGTDLQCSKRGSTSVLRWDEN